MKQKTEYDNKKIIGGTWEDVNQDSDLTYNSYDKQSREWIVDQLLPKINSSILDVGCSIGAWGAFLKKRTILLYGVDISAERLLEASKRGYITRESHGSKMPFPENYVDSVVCIDVLIHTIGRDNKLAVLKEMHRVLRRDGVAVIAFTNSLYGKTTYYCEASSFEEMKALLTEAGFAIMDVRGIQFMRPTILVKFTPLLVILDKLFNKSKPEKAKIVFWKVMKK